MQDDDIVASRTLHEWADYVNRLQRRIERKRSNKGACQWWLLRRVSTAQYLRMWWKQARTHAHEYGDLVTEWTGYSRIEQLRQMATLALRDGVCPKEYYSYKLYRAERFEQAGRYLYHEPKVRLNKLLLDRTEDHSPFNIGDKRSWLTWAQKNDIPTPCPVASFDDGDVKNWWDSGSLEDLPPKDLFSIWVDVYRGRGAQAWSFENGTYTDIESSNIRFTEDELIKYLSRKSKERPVILLERLYNHPKMTSFTSGGLATCRLVTGRFPGEGPRPIVANLKMPRGGAVVDDISAGGLAAPVNLSDGTIGLAVSGFPEPLGDRIHTHPDTGAEITGALFPFWNSVIDLAITAHKEMRNVPFVGWDITVTTEGPTIIEPNDGWGASTAEKPGGVPLPDSIYEDMYDVWIRKLDS